MGQGGATESSAGASLTHVGQSLVEIGLMNRGERAKRQGGLSFNITRRYQSKHQSSGRGGDGEVRGWHLRSSERDPGDRSPAAELSGLVSDRGYTCHWERFEPLCVQLSTRARDRAPPLGHLCSMTFQARLADSHFSLMDRWVPDEPANVQM